MIVVYLPIDDTHEQEYEAHSFEDAMRFKDSLEDLAVYVDVYDESGHVVA